MFVSSDSIPAAVNTTGSVKKMYQFYYLEKWEEKSKTVPDPQHFNENIISTYEQISYFINSRKGKWSVFLKLNSYRQMKAG